MSNELEKLFQEYQNEIHYSARLRPETIRGYGEVFKLFLKIMPEVRDIDSLTPAMLNEFFKRIETRQRKFGKKIVTGVKQTTIKTQYSKLNVFFVWLKTNGHILENPLITIPSPKVRYDDFKRLTDEGVNKIYSAITQHSTTSLMLRRDTLIVSILLFCGLRKGELIGLQVNDIDLVKKEITIRAATSKSNRTRILKIHPTLVMHLKDYLKERRTSNLKTASLIASLKNDTGLTHHGFQHWVKKLIEKSGVKLHLHQFRHTFACKLVEANVHIVNIQKLMGHTDIKMTMKYLRSIRPEDMEEDIGKISF
jgi:integrase/recombinase XerD